MRIRVQGLGSDYYLTVAAWVLSGTLGPAPFFITGPQVWGSTGNQTPVFSLKVLVIFDKMIF